MEELTYKQATLADYDDFYKIKCDPENVKWSGFASAPDYERMKEWYCKQLESEKRTYLYAVKSIADFEDYFAIKSDPTAILWSGFASAPDREKLLNHFKGLLEEIKAKNKFLVYLKDSETDALIGYDLMTKIAEDTVESSGHSILSNWQGKGMGTVLFAQLVPYAKELGFKYFTGWVSDLNIGSIKNIERNGFVKTEECRTVHLAAFDRDDVFHKYICTL